MYKEYFAKNTQFSHGSRSYKLTPESRNQYNLFILGPDTVEARNVLCYCEARELGISTLELSKRLGVSQPTASQSVKRGGKIVNEKELKMMV